LPTFKLMWAQLAGQSDKEGWPAARFLAALAEHEMADRGRRRIERHLAEARLPAGKRWPPSTSRPSPCLESSGDGAGVRRCLAGEGRQHPAVRTARRRQEPFVGSPRARPGRERMACNVHRTSDLVQRLQVARRELALESTIAKLDRYDLLILDDIAYVTKDQAETSVLFELIAARYERRSMMITANQPFGEWGQIFPDQAMTLAAIDASSTTPQSWR